MHTLTTISKIVSSVLHPLIMPLLMIIFVLYYPSIFSMLSYPNKTGALLVSIAFLFIIPMFGMWIMKKISLVQDYELTQRADRIYPILFTVISIGIGFFVLRSIEYVAIILQLYLIYIILLSLFAIITLWWKISMHTTAIGAFCGFLFVMGHKYGIDIRNFFILAILCSGIVAFSRLYLNRHTPLQVLVGFLYGFIVLTLLM